MLQPCLLAHIAGNYRILFFTRVLHKSLEILSSHTTLHTYERFI